MSTTGKKEEGSLFFRRAEMVPAARSVQVINDVSHASLGNANASVKRVRRANPSISFPSLVHGFS